MMEHINKHKLIWTTVLMITFGAEKAMAFPLPTFDLKRIATSIRDAAYQIMEIKQEVDSNLKIIKEIVNGGYGAAARDLFAKIQNGDYDRFGNNLFSLGQYAKAGSSNFQSFLDQKNREKELRSEGMAKDVAKEQAQLEGSAQRIAADNARKQAQRERECYVSGNCYGLDQDTINKIQNQRDKNKNFLSDSYDWLKDNRSVTNDAFSGIDAAKNGDAGGVLGSLLHGAGGAFNSGGNTDVGGVLQNSSGAGSALNSALSGNWGAALGQAGNAAGGAIASTGGGDLGNTISGASGSAGRTVNDFSDGRWGDGIIDAMYGASNIIGKE